MNWAQLANVAASGLVFLASLTFVVVYHLKAPTWRATRFGRNLMTATASFGLLGLYTVLITIWPSGETAAVLRTTRTAILFLLAVQIGQRVQMVIAAQRQHPPDQLSDPASPD